MGANLRSYIDSGLFLDSKISVIQNAGLVKNANSGREQEEYGDNLQTSIPKVLAVFLCAIALFKKGRESGWAVVWVISAWPVIFIAVCLFFTCGLGWHGAGQRLCGLL
jgi:hypothetical protein